MIIRIKMSKRRLKNEEDDEQKEESEPEMFELDKLTDAQIKNAGKLPSWYEQFKTKLLEYPWFKNANEYIAAWYSSSRIWKVVSPINNE